MKATMTEEGCVKLIATNSLEHFALKQHKLIEDRRAENGATIVVYDFDQYKHLDIDDIKAICEADE